MSATFKKMPVKQERHLGLSRTRWRAYVFHGVMVMELLTIFLWSSQTFAQVEAEKAEISPNTPLNKNEGIALEIGPTQQSYTEDFADPLGDWTNDWFYLNTNAENYYVAAGNCDSNYRGNQPNGLWISDDRGCHTLVSQSPVRINFINNFGDYAVLFSLDQYTCVGGVTLKLYDKDGALVVSEALTPNCGNWSRHSYTLSNGISAFEYSRTNSQVEGTTSIDNVTLVTDDKPPPPSNDCHATYSTTDQKLTVPCLCVPLLDPLTGEATDESAMFKGELGLIEGVGDFKIIPDSLAFVEMLEDESDCADYSYDTGNLHIPFVDVPSVMVLPPSIVVPGPTRVYEADLQLLPLPGDVFHLTGYEYLYTIEE